MGEAQRRGTFDQRRQQSIVVGNQKSHNLNVDLDKLPDVICGAELPDDGGICECKIFFQTIQYKKISGIISPTGQDQVVMLSFIKCSQCGATKDLKNA